MSKNIDDEVLIFNTIQDIKDAITGSDPAVLGTENNGALTIRSGLVREKGDHNRGVDLLVLQSPTEIPRISVDSSGDEFFLFDEEHAIEPLYQTSGFVRFEMALVIQGEK